MNLKKLCEGIKLQEEMILKIDAFMSGYDMDSLEPLIKELADPKTTFSGMEKLKEKFKDGAPENIPLLTCLLLAAVHNYSIYQEKGISDRIFYDTMGVLYRYCKEHHDQTGKWEYDGSGWSCRHVSMRMFRIGILEYEFVEREEENRVAIHIPADTIFTEENLDLSITGVKEFIAKFYPEHVGERICCGSWIMAPKLKELLPETSGIMRFHNRFAAIEELSSPYACMNWVFQADENTPVCDLPEKTSLQRKIKTLMMNGEFLNAGFGVLK